MKVVSLQVNSVGIQERKFFFWGGSDLLSSTFLIYCDIAQQLID